MLAGTILMARTPYSALGRFKIHGNPGFLFRFITEALRKVCFYPPCVFLLLICCFAFQGIREASAVLAAGDGDAGGPTRFLRGQAGLLGVPSRAMSKGATLAQHQQHQHQQAAHNDGGARGDDGDDDGADVGGGGGGGGVAAQDSSGEADCYQVCDASQSAHPPPPPPPPPNPPLLCSA